MDTLSQKVNDLPHVPGVYQFFDAEKTVIYVGKAIDLHRRVGQYFDASHVKSPKTEQLVSHITDVSTIQVISEFDALLLESKLIKAYQPKYNIIAKDDTSPIYITISFGDQLPYIRLTRKTKIDVHDAKTAWFGPFQSARIAKSILRSIRQVIPYCTQQKRTGHPCFYTHIGLCDPCPSLIASMPHSGERTRLVTEYRRHCRQIRDILDGKSDVVRNMLSRSMESYASAQQFEKAMHARDQLKHLNDLFAAHYDPSLYLTDEQIVGETVEQEMESLLGILSGSYPNLSSLGRIECIDISNTAGQYPVGSLVVLTGGRTDKAAYRRFAITAVKGPNDVAMIANVLERRLHHREWPMPDLLVIDGGSGQVKSAKHVLDRVGLPIPVIGLAKRFETIIIPKSPRLTVSVRIPTTTPAIHLIQRIRDESHRFAITYHRLLRKKAFLPE